MQVDLFWLTLTILMTALLWVPYILAMIAQIGLVQALTEGGGTVTPDAPWAARLKKAHVNAVENLIVFAPLVLMIVYTEKASALTALIAMIYFAARALHALVFTLGVPGVRTVCFVTGVGCQVALALVLLGLL